MQKCACSVLEIYKHTFFSHTFSLFPTTSPTVVLIWGCPKSVQ